MGKLKALIGRIPFVGHALVASPWSAHKSACSEILVGVVFSSMPIWLGALIVTLTARMPAEAAGQSFAAVLSQRLGREMEHGELLLLGSSSLATVLYLALASRPFHTNKPFPGQLSHVITVVLILIAASCVFFVGRGNESLGMPWLFTFSLYVYGIALLLWYTACVYDNERMSYEGDAQKQDDQFQSEYAEHRETHQ